jgi:hypothetical protein
VVEPLLLQLAVAAVTTTPPRRSAFLLFPFSLGVSAIAVGAFSLSPLVWLVLFLISLLADAVCVCVCVHLGQMSI